MTGAKVALITGAAKRLGSGMARCLHAAGYNVVVHHRNSCDEAGGLVDELNALRRDSAIALRADLQRAEELDGLVCQVLSVWAGVDVLINNASSFYPGSVGQVGESDWDCLMGSNLKAPFFLTQALAPSLQARSGCVINMVDIHAERGLLGYPVYSIAKAGLVAMTKCLAKELAPDIRVNAIAPGAILWPEHEVDEVQQHEILQKVALRCSGTVADIAAAVKFLVADAHYVTGQVLVVDGGRLLFS